MGVFQRRVAGRVFGIHIGVVLMVLSFSGLKGCFQRKPKPEIVTFVEFGQPAPAVNVQEVADQPDPEPPAPRPDPPKPEPPPPKPTRVPEEPKKIIKPPKVVRPKPPKKVEPTWKPTPVDQIKLGEKVEPAAPPKPVITQQDLDKLRNAVKSTTSPPGPVGSPSADAAYVSEITRFFDRKWSHPANASPSSSAIVRIYISKWGTITKRQKIQGSGDRVFDDSVMAAVNSVKTVAKPPANYSYEYVEVEFRIRN